MKSSRNRKNSIKSYSIRRKSVNKEDYYTDRNVIEHIVENAIVPLINQENIKLFVDSSAGDAYLSTAIKSRLADVKVKNFDLNPKSDSFETITCCDFLKTKPKNTSRTVKTMVGFNPPFGINGKLANDFILHSIKSWKADMMIFILPYIVSKNDYDGYDKITVKQLPRNSFIHPNGVDFDYPAFLCIYKKRTDSIISAENKKIANLNSVAGSLVGKKPRNLPSHVLTIKQYRNVIGGYKEDVVILVRRIGNNCGKHGFVYKNDIWKEYRFAQILSGTDKKRPPKLTEGAFLMIILKNSTTWTKINDIITKISNIREERKYKRTVSSDDIIDALNA